MHTTYKQRGMTENPLEQLIKTNAAYARVARFFLGAICQKREIGIYTKGPKIHIMAIKFTQWP
jgi:hypothetical protein